MSKPTLNVVSLSGGKDSSAMLLMMLEKKMPIDIILFCDTGLEFPLMYEHLDKLEKTINMPITRVRADKPYEYYFLEAPVKRKHETEFSKKFGFNHKGYGWAGPKMRWCTSVLKDTPREHFLRPLREKYEIKEYIGIAADETYRLKRKRNQNPNHIHPLVEWGITEADCLKYCYDHGFDWGGLYRFLSGCLAGAVLCSRYPNCVNCVSTIRSSGESSKAGMRKHGGNSARIIASKSLKPDSILRMSV